MEYKTYKKRCFSIKSDTLSMKTFINELDFLKKGDVIQWNAWKEEIYFCTLTNW